MGGRLHSQGQLTGSEGKLHFLLGLWGVLPLRRATGSLCLNSRGGRAAGGGGERTAERKEGGREKTRTGQRGGRQRDRDIQTERAGKAQRRLLSFPDLADFLWGLLCVPVVRSADLGSAPHLIGQRSLLSWPLVDMSLATRTWRKLAGPSREGVSSPQALGIGPRGS